MKRFFLFLFSLMHLLAWSQPYPFQDETLPRHERIMDLLGRLTLEEKSDLMQATSHGFLVWAFLSIFMATKHYTESSVLDVLRYSHRPLPSVLHGIPNLSTAWLQPSAMRPVDDGMSWNTGTYRKTSLAISSPFGVLLSIWRVIPVGGVRLKHTAKILT